MGLAGLGSLPLALPPVLRVPVAGDGCALRQVLVPAVVGDVVAWWRGGVVAWWRGGVTPCTSRLCARAVGDACLLGGLASVGFGGVGPGFPRRGRGLSERAPWLASLDRGE